MLIEVPEYFNGPFLKKDKILYRHYQVNIFKKCKNRNSLVILATGLGKTIIGILLIAHCLRKYNTLGKIIIMAPTRPLVSQHKLSCEKFIDLDNNQIAQLTGKISPEKRIQLFNSRKIIISTPQVIKNDLLRGRYELKHVSLIIFDEAHRTRGNYAYNFISKEYIKSCTDPLILGLTASPGKNYDYIQQLCTNLFIENVIFKNYDDEDVLKYIYEIDTFLERVNLPVKLLELCEIWDNLFKKFLRFFIEKNLINPYKSYYSKIDFLKISHDLTISLNFEKFQNHETINEEYLDKLFFKTPKIIDIVREKKLNIQSIFSYCSSCISILHAKDLLETQDISIFNSFLDKIKYKAEQNILSAKRIINSRHYNYIKSIIEKSEEISFHHPKINKIISIINEEIEEFHNKKIIIFTQFREMAENLKNRLKNVFFNKLIIEKFIGQSTKIDDYGYSQYKQLEVLQKFRNNEINILIATSVAEEGLDIPNVDAIIFYEPIPSEIRLIQRRGRTGRSAPGRCYILITEGTVDVPYFIVSRKKEAIMNSILLNPKELKLKESFIRKKINFSNNINTYSEHEIVQNFKKRRKKEEELLANRSIDEIISELDAFTKSQEYIKYKNFGVSFFSDMIKVDRNNLREKLLKIKKVKSISSKEQKKYINKNVKTLVNIAKTYCKDGILNFSKFRSLAEEEDIIERKFYTHFNRACYLGFLKKQKDNVYFLSDYR